MYLEMLQNKKKSCHCNPSCINLSMTVQQIFIKDINEKQNMSHQSRIIIITVLQLLLIGLGHKGTTLIIFSSIFGQLQNFSRF